MATALGAPKKGPLVGSNGAANLAPAALGPPRMKNPKKIKQSTLFNIT